MADPGYYPAVSITSVSGEDHRTDPPKEDHRTDPLLGHIRDREVIWDSQQSFTKGKSCLTSLWPSMME